MNKILVISLILLSVTVLVTATFYPEPWGNNQDANDQNLTNVNYVFADTINVDNVTGLNCLTFSNGAELCGT